MSELWVGEHQTLHTHVVVKFLSPDLLRDKVSVARFQREAKAAAQVRSPHVVQYLDHGVCEHGPYLVMELLEGEDLASRLKRGPMSLQDTAQVIVQTSRALNKAHSAGIVHRDIKPENIFLVEVGGNDIFCKLIDFGVAKGRGESMPTMSKTATGSLLGTPYYMSPEQAINARDSDFRTDIWALGMVCFEAMTGRRAIEVDGLGALVLALHTIDLPAPSTINKALPAAVDAWFARACAREPEERFGSAREMAEAFLKAIDRPSGGAGLMLETPVPRPAVVPSLIPPGRVSDKAPAETPPKVPTLRPPPPTTTRRGVEEKREDDSWKHLIERTNQVQPTRHSPVPPSPRPSQMHIEPPAPPKQPNAALWLAAVALGLLLFVGLSLAVRGSGALRELFPGLYSSAVPGPSSKP